MKGKLNVNWPVLLLILSSITLIVVASTAWGFLGFLLSIVILTLVLLAAYLFFRLESTVHHPKKLESEGEKAPAPASEQIQNDDHKKNPVSENTED